MGKYLLIMICLLLSACLTSTKQETHTHCAQEGNIPIYENYCCGTYSNGHCSYTCQRQAGSRIGCIRWQCDEGYQWQESSEDEKKWWQIFGAGQCVPET
jgi:hypothetical protein